MDWNIDILAVITTVCGLAVGITGQTFDCRQCDDSSCPFKYKIGGPKHCYFEIPENESLEFFPDGLLEEFPLDKEAAVYSCQKYNARLPFFTHEDSDREHRKAFYDLALEINDAQAIPSIVQPIFFPTDIRLTVKKSDQRFF